MPKHGLDVSACEVFRFYKLVTLKGLIEPISMIVPRRVSTSVQISASARGAELTTRMPCLWASLDSGAGSLHFCYPVAPKKCGFCISNDSQVRGMGTQSLALRPCREPSSRVHGSVIQVKMLEMQWMTNGLWPAVYSKRNTLGVILLPTIFAGNDLFLLPGKCPVNLLATSLAHSLVSQACFSAGCG